MNISFSAEVNQHINDCKFLGLPIEEAFVPIIFSSARYPDSEVLPVLASLPDEILERIRETISAYQSSGKIFVFTNSGSRRDVSSIICRISSLFDFSVKP